MLKFQPFSMRGGAIHPRTYLYKEGDECTDVTGGYSTWQTSQVHAYIRDTYLEIDSSAGVDGGARCYTNSRIDFSKYSSIGIRYDRTMSNYNVHLVAFDSLPDNRNVPSVANVTLTKSNATNRTEVFEIPQAMKGNYYFALNGDNSTKAYEIWLE